MTGGDPRARGPRGRGERRNNRDRGAAAVEFAMVLPVLLLLVFGIIDFGRMLNAQISVNEAARESTRAVALGATAAQADDRADALFSGEDTAAVTAVSTACPINPTATQDAKVTVTHQFGFVTPLGFLAGILPNGTANGTLTLASVGVMPCRG